MSFLPRAFALWPLVLVMVGCGHADTAAAMQAHGDMALAESASSSVDYGPRPGMVPAMRRVAMQEAVAAPASEPSRASTGGEQMIVTGSVVLRTADVAALVQAVRAHTAQVGGSVVAEAVTGNAEEGHAVMRLRLPPPAIVPFADWLATQATLESRNLQAEDVSRQFLDQQLALKNLHITMGRLQELAGRPNAPLNDVLQVEHELTRVRGEIERLEGEHRLLADQIARATLAVDIQPHKRAAHVPELHVEPELKFELTPHFTVLHFVDQGAGHQTRAWGGVALIFARPFTLDFTILPRDGADPRAYLFSASFAGYSDFLGGGRRRFLNPYLGLRLGTGSVGDHALFSFGGEAGVELVRTRLFLVDLTGRALGFVFGKNVTNQLVLEAALGVGVPF